MQVSSSHHIRAIDSWAQAELGLDPLVLMESAAAQVAGRVLARHPGLTNAVVLAGGGNNGGDALAVARHLACRGIEVDVFLCGNRLSKATKRNLNMLKHIGAAVTSINEASDSALVSRKLAAAQLAIDGLLGIGLKPPLSSVMVELIAAVNECQVLVAAIDIASGVLADTGEVAETAIRANETYAIYSLKPGHLLHPGKEYCGRVEVCPLGLPPVSPWQLVTTAAVKKLLPSRRVTAHKYTAGKALIVAGSQAYSGAAVIAALACSRAGAGMVTVAVPESIAAAVAARVCGPVVLPLPDCGGTVSPEAWSVIRRELSSCQAALIGPGLTTGGAVRELVLKIVTATNVPLILDADALNVLNWADLQHREASIAVTPHAQELARLLNQDVGDDIWRWRSAAELAQQTGIVVVAKGAPTITVCCERCYFNGSGNSALATAGTGDALAGIITALAAQGLQLEQAAIVGNYIHGLCADIYTAKGYLPHSFTADVLLDLLPESLKTISQEG